MTKFIDTSDWQHNSNQSVSMKRREPNPEKRENKTRKTEEQVEQQQESYTS
jgi:hypothetical protein